MERGDGNSSSTSRAPVNIIRIKIKAHPTEEVKQPNQEADKNKGKIELNLGLSMNGRFGVDPSSAKTRKRSYSVSNLPGDAAGTLARGEARAEHPGEEARGFHAQLPRASSLPADRGEWWWGGGRRQREEVEAAAAARKKRMEKRRRVRVVRGDVVKNGGSGLHEGEKGGVNVGFHDNDRVNGSGSPMMVQYSDGGSQTGSGSAGFHEAPTMMMGANSFNTMPGSSSSYRIPNAEHGVPRSSTAVDSDRDDKWLLESAMLNMPHVSTMGDGDDRINGILYKYARAGEVKIVCACHGLFLSPAEFIKHGGGSDVEQPLKHIIVNSCPSL